MSSKTYSGSCHCQAVSFDVEVDTDQALQCKIGRASCRERV